MNGNGGAFNDGELELCAESTLPPQKPPLRNKWSKIPVRLGSSFNNIPPPLPSSSSSSTDTAGKSGTPVPASTIQLNNISNDNSINKASINGSGIASSGVSSTDSNSTEARKQEESEKEGRSVDDATTSASNSSNSGENRENGEKQNGKQSNSVNASHEEVGTSSGVNGGGDEERDEENGDTTLHGSNTTTPTTISGSGSIKGIGIESIAEIGNIVNKGSNKSSTTSGTSSGSRSGRRGTSNKANISSSSLSLSSKSSSHHHHHHNNQTLSDATIANADALAYFQDDMIKVNLMGDKREHKDGFPLHICSGCDLPIAVYGRLVLILL